MHGHEDVRRQDRQVLPEDGRLASDDRRYRHRGDLRRRHAREATGTRDLLLPLGSDRHAPRGRADSDRHVGAAGVSAQDHGPVHPWDEVRDGPDGEIRVVDDDRYGRQSQVRIGVWLEEVSAFRLASNQQGGGKEQGNTFFFHFLLFLGRMFYSVIRKSRSSGSGPL